MMPTLRIASSPSNTPLPVPKATSWPPPSTMGRCPTLISRFTIPASSCCACSSCVPWHTISPASASTCDPWCHAIPANARRISCGASAAPSRPWLRRTPSSLQKPNNTVPDGVAGSSAEMTCHTRRVSPLSPTSVRPRQTKRSAGLCMALLSSNKDPMERIRREIRD